MVKAVTLVFYSIQQYFIRYIRAEFGIPNLAKSPDNWQKLDKGISDFRISAKFFINENCHNSRTSHDIGIKLGPVTKLDKTNTATLKKFDNDFISANCDFIIFFPVYGHISAIWKPDIGRMVYKTYIFINNNLLSYRTRKQN